MYAWMGNETLLPRTVRYGHSREYLQEGHERLTPLTNVNVHPSAIRMQMAVLFHPAHISEGVPQDGRV